MSERPISSTNVMHYLYGHTESEPVDIMSAFSEINQRRVTSDLPQHGTLATRNPLMSLQRLVEETSASSSDALPYSLSSFPKEFGLCKSGIPGATFGVYAKTMIPLGTWIGPYEGKVTIPHAEEDQQDDQLWEVFVDGNVTLMVNSQDVNSGNWMRYIQPARHSGEQNLEVLQYQGTIYYRVMQDLESGTELLVWYGGQYTQYMGIPLQQSGSTDDRYKSTERIIEPKRVETESRQSTVASGGETTSLERSQRAARFSQLETWKCGQCFRTFSQRSSLQMHVCDTSANRPFLCGYCCCSFAVADDLKNHVASHAAEKPFKCGFCHRAFAGATTLSNHMRTHTNSRPFRCHKCGTDFTQGIQYSRHIRTGECSGSRQQDDCAQDSVEEQEEEQEMAATASPDDKQKVAFIST